MRRWRNCASGMDDVRGRVANPNLGRIRIAGRFLPHPLKMIGGSRRLAARVADVTTLWLQKEIEVETCRFFSRLKHARISRTKKQVWSAPALSFRPSTMT